MEPRENTSALEYFPPALDNLTSVRVQSLLDIHLASAVTAHEAFQPGPANRHEAAAHVLLSFIAERLLGNRPPAPTETYPPIVQRMLVT